jgi:hypothetical protein
MSLYRSAMDKIPPKSRTNKCIVLDLDETLVHSNYDINNLKKLNIMTDPDLIDLRQRIYQICMDDVTTDKGSGIKTVMWGLVRPHAREFLLYCFAYFKCVIVWSAGKRKYVDTIVDYLFKDMRRPIVVYSYDECEKLSNNMLVKPFSKMIKNVSGLDKYMNLSNSFMIDDRDTVYRGYEGDNPYNGIQIPPYKPDFNIQSMRADDIALKQLMIWLNQSEVMNSSDVRTLDKSKIFSINVTTNHNKNMDLIYSIDCDDECKLENSKFAKLLGITDNQDNQNNQNNNDNINNIDNQNNINNSQDNINNIDIDDIDNIDRMSNEIVSNIRPISVI